MHLTFISRKCEVHVISENKEYVISIVYKSKLIQLNSVSKPTFVINKYSIIIPSKFKAMKFIPK